MLVSLRVRGSRVRVFRLMMFKDEGVLGLGDLRVRVFRVRVFRVAMFKGMGIKG